MEARSKPDAAKRSQPKHTRSPWLGFQREQAFHGEPWLATLYRERGYSPINRESRIASIRRYAAFDRQCKHTPFYRLAPLFR